MKKNKKINNKQYKIYFIYLKMKVILNKYLKNQKLKIKF